MPLSPSGRHASHGAASGALAALLQHPQYAASIADSEHSRGEGSAGGTFADRESHWHDQLVRSDSAHAQRANLDDLFPSRADNAVSRSRTQALANAQLTAERTRAADAESLLIQQLRASTSAREEARCSAFIQLSLSFRRAAHTHAAIETQAHPFPCLHLSRQALERIAEKDAEIQRLTDGLSEVARVRRAFDELASTHENQMARVEQHVPARHLTPLRQPSWAAIT